MADRILGYEGSNPAEEPVGDNPKHKMVMAWKVKDELGEHEINYYHGSSGLGSSHHNYAMFEGDHVVGSMGMDAKGRIQHIEVHPDRRRMGLASKMLKVGQDIHKEIESIPAPTHSDTRTKSGEAWAKSMGAKPAKSKVSEEEFKSRRWTPLQSKQFDK